jgi:hypothetical protein
LTPEPFPTDAALETCFAGDCPGFGFRWLKTRLTSLAAV